MQQRNVEQKLSDKRQISVLFFARDNCHFSNLAIKHLESIGVTLTVVISKRRNEQIPTIAHGWSGDYILSFRSFFYLPREIYSRAEIAAINFHPGPKEYPGSGCINFALYEDARWFGVTAHLMSEKIDSGPIIDEIIFSIDPLDNVESLLKKTHEQLFQLFLKTTEVILSQGDGQLSNLIEKNRNSVWRGRARKMSELESLQNFPADISRDELARRIRATYTKDWRPFVTLHGFRFTLDPLLEEN